MPRNRIASLLLILLAFATLTAAATHERWVTALIHCGAFTLAAGALWRRRKEAWILPWEALPLLVPVLVGLAQRAAGSTANGYLTDEAILFWAALASLAAAARVALAEVSVRHHFLTVSAAFGAAVAALCLFQAPLRGADLFGWRVPDFDLMAGPFGNRNTYASLVELLLPAAVWKSVTAKKGRWAWWAVSMVMPATVLVTGSRAGSLLVLLELGILLLVQIRAKVLFPLTGVAMVVMATGWDTLADRITQEDWTSHRNDIYSATWRMIQERPFTGHGLGTFIDVYPRFTKFDVGRVVHQAHNDWLEWGAGGGLIAVLPLLGLLGWAAYRARRHIWSWGIAFALAHSLVDYPLNRLSIAGWFWVYVSMVIAAGVSEKTPGNRRRSGRRKKNQTEESRPVEQAAAAATPPSEEVPAASTLSPELAVPSD